MALRSVFVTGGTGYVGSRLIVHLLNHGHHVRALVRRGSELRLPPGAIAVVGDALHAASYAGQVAPSDTLVHLVGVAHPSPAKAAQFLSVDLASARAAAEAAGRARIGHLVYVSVAQPAPVMKAYQAARAEGERLMRQAGVPAVTILRPWYVLGPGHRWPYLLLPLYALLERLPATRPAARRLGLVRVRDMVAALTEAVEHAPGGVRVVEVPDIRGAARRATPASAVPAV